MENRKLKLFNLFNYNNKMLTSPYIYTTGYKTKSVYMGECKKTTGNLLCQWNYIKKTYDTTTVPTIESIYLYDFGYNFTINPQTGNSSTTIYFYTCFDEQFSFPATIDYTINNSNDIYNRFIPSPSPISSLVTFDNTTFCLINNGIYTVSLGSVEQGTSFYFSSWYIGDDGLSQNITINDSSC